MQQEVLHLLRSEDLVRKIKRDQGRFGGEERVGEDGGCGFGVALPIEYRGQSAVECPLDNSLTHIDVEFRPPCHVPNSLPLLPSFQVPEWCIRKATANRPTHNAQASNVVNEIWECSEEKSDIR